MQHIIWVTPGFAANEEDSQCIPPQQLLAQALCEQTDLQLHIVSLHYPNRADSYGWHRAKVYPCHANGPFSRLRIWWRALRQIKKLLHSYPNAILHSFWLTDACAVSCLANRLKQPHLVTLMGQDARPSNRYLRFLPLRRLYKIALSKFHNQQFHRSTGLIAEEVIPWGIPLSSDKAEADRPYHLIGVGSLITLKGYQKFIQLVGELRQTIPDLQAALIGDGPQRQSLEDQIEKQGLSDHIHLTGSLERSEVMEYMRKAKLFVHTSTYESFGFVLIEAMNEGAGVVSTAVGIAPEIPAVSLAEDVDEMEIAVRSALQQQERIALPERFQLRQTMEAYQDLYRRLLATASE